MTVRETFIIRESESLFNKKVKTLILHVGNGGLAYAVGARCQWPGVVKLRGPVRIYMSSSAAPVDSPIQFLPLWNSSFPTTTTPGGDEQARQEHRSSFLANGRGMRQFLMVVVWPLSYSRTHESSHVTLPHSPHPLLWDTGMRAWLWERVLSLWGVLE